MSDPKEVFDPFAESEWVFIADVPCPMRLRDYFALLGSAIVEWNYIESQIYDVCYLAVGPCSDALADVFAKLGGFENRLTATTSALKRGIRDEQVNERWRSLSNAINQQRSTRNAIAHCILVDSADIGAPHFMPAFNDPKMRKNWNDVYKVGVPEIEKFLIACRALNRDIRFFVAQTISVRDRERAAQALAAAATSPVSAAIPDE